MAWEINKQVQSAFAVTTTNKILVTEKEVGQDVYLQNNHASAIVYINVSGKATHALPFTSGGSGGTKEISVDDTITGESGGATANVVSITIDSGAWGTNDAAGTLYVDTIVGVFESETLKVGSDLDLANISSDVDRTRMAAIKPGGGEFSATNTPNEIYAIGSAAMYLVKIIGAKSGGPS